MARIDGFPNPNEDIKDLEHENNIEIVLNPEISDEAVALCRNLVDSGIYKKFEDGINEIPTGPETGPYSMTEVEYDTKYFKALQSSDRRTVCLVSKDIDIDGYVEA